MKRGFTLIELLVVIFVVATLMAILIPSLSRAREQAKIVVVNTELRQIGIALEMYYDDNGKYPPTQADCIGGSLTNHLYQLPKVLATGKYLPSTSCYDPMSTIMEDRFNRGHTYKYRSVGEIIVDRDRIHTKILSKLWIPNRFPAGSSIDPGEGRFRPDPNEQKLYEDAKELLPLLLPVRWVVFSVGPRFSEEWLEEQVGKTSRYPVPKELWYTPKQRRGFVVRMRLRNGTQIGSFEGNL
jgi:type II secretion system protein G